MEKPKKSSLSPKIIGKDARRPSQPKRAPIAAKGTRKLYTPKARPNTGKKTHARGVSRQKKNKRQKSSSSTRERLKARTEMISAKAQHLPEMAAGASSPENNTQARKKKQKSMSPTSATSSSGRIKSQKQHPPEPKPPLTSKASSSGRTKPQKQYTQKLMPPLTIGTAAPVRPPLLITPLADILQRAIDVGYTSFDISDRYADKDFVAEGMYKNIRSEYYHVITNALQKLPSGNDVWLTVKGRRDQVDDILKQLAGYHIDLYLLQDSLFAQPPKAHEKVRNWGIENPSDSDIKKVWSQECPYKFVQLQAKRVDMVRVLNEAGINVQVFSPISQLRGSLTQEFKDQVMKFCIQTYILNTPHTVTNSIVVGSQFGASIAHNMNILHSCLQQQLPCSQQDFSPVLQAFKEAVDRTTGSH